MRFLLNFQASRVLLLQHVAREKKERKKERKDERWKVGEI